MIPKLREMRLAIHGSHFRVSTRTGSPSIEVGFVTRAGHPGADIRPTCVELAHGIVKFTVPLVPVAVVTLTVLGTVLPAAFTPSVQVCVIVLPFADTVTEPRLIPVVEPERFTVAPMMKFDPVSVTVNGAPLRV